jgi:hypothetical protein
MHNTSSSLIRSAFKCDALYHQFTVIDVEDGLHDGTTTGVASYYDVAGLVAEAVHWLDICQHNLRDLQGQSDSEDYRVWKREAKQLHTFIKKWGA